MQQAVAPSHSLGETLSLQDTARSASLTLHTMGPTGDGSYMDSSGFPALLWPLFLHGGQVTSQCHSPEEHHAGQPARPQSSAPPLMGLWAPQGGHWEGGDKERGLHSAGRDSGRDYHGLEGVATQNMAELKRMG